MRKYGADGAVNDFKSPLITRIIIVIVNMSDERAIIP